MQRDDTASRPIHRNLDTAYVNLAALLHYLQARDFKGRVHVLLDEYEADVYLEGAGATTQVREMDHAAGRLAEGEAALHRLLVRAREPGGQISVYSDEAADDEPSQHGPSAEPSKVFANASPGPEEIEWSEVLSLSGQLIAAVERAALSFGADFNAVFRNVRLELAEDFPLLDPTAQRFQYLNGAVRMSLVPEVNAYLSGISEALRRVVDRLVATRHGRSMRERVALELAVLARRREALIRRLKLMPQLERIAGTKVL